MQVDWMGQWEEIAIWVIRNGRFGPGDDEINPGSDWVVFWDDDFFGGPDFVFQVEDGRVTKVEIHGFGADGPADENVIGFGATVRWLGPFYADFKRFFGKHVVVVADEGDRPGNPRDELIVRLVAALVTEVVAGTSRDYAVVVVVVKDSLLFVWDIARGKVLASVCRSHADPVCTWIWNELILRVDSFGFNYNMISLT